MVIVTLGCVLVTTNHALLDLWLSTFGWASWAAIYQRLHTTKKNFMAFSSRQEISLVLNFTIKFYLTFGSEIWS